MQQAHETLRARLGPVHEKTLRCLSMLAKLLHAMDRPGDAHRLSEEALSGYRSTLGEHHPDTAQMVKTHREIAAGAVKKKELERVRQAAKEEAEWKELERARQAAREPEEEQWAQYGGLIITNN